MLANVKEFVRKHDNLTVFCVLFVILLGFGLNITIVDYSDELWNFMNIQKIYNGYEMYKNINIIVTPLFFYIGEIFFKVFGVNFLVFRLYNIIINVILYLAIYSIFKELKISKAKSLIYTLFMFLFSSATLTCMANYTSMAIMFCAIGILLSIKNNRNYILQGIIIFLIFMSKQNIAVFYILGEIFAIIFVKKINKENIIFFIKKMLVFSVLLGIFGVYLYLNDNLFNFVSYCFLGMNEFSKNNIGAEILSVLVFIFIIAIYIFLKYMYKTKKIKEENFENYKKINILACFAIPMLLIAYPIFNESHIHQSVIFIAICIIYFIETAFIKDFFNNKNAKKFLLVFFVILNIISLYHVLNWIIYTKNNNFKNEYFGSMIEDQLINNIDTITKYIKENPKKVIVFSGKAAYYTIITKENNEEIDLPLLGNFGKNGEDGVLNKISNLRNTNILITKDEDDRIYQESLKIRHWIQENLKCVGEIEEFLIYETE